MEGSIYVMINFFKGVIGGIGNIIPGLSGSALLIIFGIYQSCLDAITEIVRFKNLKKNILFLLPIAFGIAIGTVLFAKIIRFFLNQWPMPTSYAFLGFIIGTLPLLFKEANKEGFNIKYLIPLVITAGIGIFLMLLKNAEVLQMTNISLGQGIILGAVLASSSIIPGISSTVLLSIIGMYDVYLKAIDQIDVVLLFPIGIGFVAGVIFFAFVISFLLKKHYGYTYYFITGFVISTIPAVLRGSLGINWMSLISIIIAICSFLLTYSVGIKRSKKELT